MILSGPIVRRGSSPSGATRGQATSRTSASPSAYDAMRTRRRSAPLAPALQPLGDTAAELEVDEPDDPDGCRGLHGAAVDVGPGPVDAEHRAEAAVGLEPLALGDDALTGRQEEHLQGTGVEPAVVTVAADQHDRLVGLDRVEVGDHRRVVPGGRAVAPADDGQVGPLGEPFAHQRDRVRRSTSPAPGRAARTSATTGRGGRAGPTGPASASRPSALGSAAGSIGGHDAVGDGHVDRPVGAGSVTDDEVDCFEPHGLTV